MQHLLEVQQITKSFQQAQSQIEVLKGVSFSMEPGETLAIVGHSGSGKSTLLSLLAGLDHPSSGSVSVSGQPIDQMNEKELSRFRAKEIGIVFQQFHLVSHLNALENVSLPLDFLGEPNAQSKAAAVLEQVGLGDRLEHFPRQLSGGEKQRVAIARSMVIEPSILLADEPSGNLDPDTGNRVMQQLFDLVEEKKMSLILVTHNQELASRCQRTFRIVQGHLEG